MQQCCVLIVQQTFDGLVLLHLVAQLIVVPLATYIAGKGKIRSHKTLNQDVTLDKVVHTLLLSSQGDNLHSTGAFLVKSNRYSYSCQ